MNKKCCNDCKWYKSTGEYIIKAKFVDGVEYVEGTAVEKPTGAYGSDFGRIFGTIVHCMNPVCFDITEGFDKIAGHQKYRIRKSGCAQLNKDCDCIHYKRKWWKFLGVGLK